MAITASKLYDYLLSRSPAATLSKRLSPCRTVLPPPALGGLFFSPSFDALLSLATMNSHAAIQYGHTGGKLIINNTKSMKSILRTVLYTILAVFLGILIFVFIAELFHPDEFGVGVTWPLALIYAAIVGAPYSIVLLLLARFTKNTNSLRPKYLIPSVMVITIALDAWLNSNLSAIKGEMWPLGVVAIAYLVYAMAYCALVNKYSR